MSKGWQLDFGDHILGSPQIPTPFHSHMVKIWTPKGAINLGISQKM